jgi:hypothetical protein
MTDEVDGLCAELCRVVGESGLPDEVTGIFQQRMDTWQEEYAFWLQVPADKTKEDFFKALTVKQIGPHLTFLGKTKNKTKDALVASLLHVASLTPDFPRREVLDDQDVNDGDWSPWRTLGTFVGDLSGGGLYEIKVLNPHKKRSVVVYLGETNHLKRRLEEHLDHHPEITKLPSHLRVLFRVQPMESGWKQAELDILHRIDYAWNTKDNRKRVVRVPALLSLHTTKQKSRSSSF